MKRFAEVLAESGLTVAEKANPGDMKKRVEKEVGNALQKVGVKKWDGPKDEKNGIFRISFEAGGKKFNVVTIVDSYVLDPEDEITYTVENEDGDVVTVSGVGDGMNFTASELPKALKKILGK